eukprot:765526-Hanusia_phi.AAC.5
MGVVNKEGYEFACLWGYQVLWVQDIEGVGVLGLQRNNKRPLFAVEADPPAEGPCPGPAGPRAAGSVRRARRRRRPAQH